MGFLNAMLLFGAASLAVPLIIHLLNRSRFQVIDWGAMHLLEAAELQNSRRIQWQSILLLLIRCLIPVILAICMARPILTAWQVAGGNGSSTVAFVVDDSYSMQALAANNPEQKTAFQQATQQIESIANGMGRGTQLSTITLGGTPRNALEGSTFDTRLLRRKLNAMFPDQGPVQISSALELASRLLVESSQAKRHLIVLSDFQREDWNGLGKDSFAAMRQAFQSLPVQPTISLVPIPTQPTSNLQVRLAAEYTEVVGIGDPFEVRATIRHTGTDKPNAVRVVFQVDDVDIAAKNLDIAANTESQVVFGCKFDAAGQHHARVRVEDTGPIHADDIGQLDVEVLDKLSVLLVEQSPNQDPLQSETGFFELAILMQSATPDQSSWIQSRRVAVDSLTEPMIRQSDVIVLANVPRLPDQPAQWIESRVREGAGLMLFAGDKLDREWYNQRWSPMSNTPLLPLRFGEPRTNANPASSDGGEKNASSSELASKSITVASGPYNHPSLSLFNQRDQGRLDAIQVRSWLILEAWPAGETDPSKQPAQGLDGTEATMAALSNGEPFLAEKKFDKGTVIQCATSCNDAWTNMPLRPAFVPLMQRCLIGTIREPKLIQQSTTADESKLVYLEQAELEKLAQSIGAQLHASSASFLETAKLQSEGREIWRWLLMALVVFLFSELLLEKRLTRGGR